MALLHSLENSGNQLFKLRGKIPVILFLIAVPAIYFTNYAVHPFWYSSFCFYTAITFSITGFGIRAYTIATTTKNTSGRNTERQIAEQLNDKGIYSVVRHPLYLGNYFMWTGIVVYSENLWFVITVSLAYWIYYERIMFAEERFLETKFGETYLVWSQKVPAFIPDFKKFIPSQVPFSIKSIIRREYSGMLATVIGFIWVEILKNFAKQHKFEISAASLYLLITALFVALLIKTIKKNTSLLYEDDRS